MATKLSSKTILEKTKSTPVWQIGILFPDGKKISKPRCTLNDIFNTYFIGLDKYLDKNIEAEELMNKYENAFKEKNIKIAIHYIDSWGHKWKGKVAWPKRIKFIEFLNRRLND